MSPHKRQKEMSNLFLVGIFSGSIWNGAGIMHSLP